MIYRQPNPASEMMNSNTHTASLENYNSIQTLRAFAAILVVLMHMLFFYGDSLKYIGGSDTQMSGYYFFKGFGGCGLQIFFVISGFVMAFLYEKKETANFSDFVTRRLTRIVPLYWLVTLLTFILSDAGSISLLKLVQSLFFIPRPDNSTVVGPGWSLNFEMFFYALFGVAALVFRCSFFWIGVVFLCMNALGRMSGNYVMRLYSDPIVWNFVAGIAVYYAHTYFEIRKKATLIFTIGVLLLLSTIFWHLPNDSKDLPQLFPWGAPSVLIVLGATSMEVSKRGVLLFGSKILLTLGEASYALYLVHGLCFMTLTGFLLHKIRLQDFLTPDGAILAYLAICCLIAIVVNKWVEKPSIFLVRKMLRAKT